MPCLVDIPGGLPFSKAEGRRVDLGREGLDDEGLEEKGKGKLLFGCNI